MKKSIFKSAKALSLVLMLLFFISASTALTASATGSSHIPAATDSFYVNDFAKIFSEDEKTEMMEKAEELSETSVGIQVVVTTVESLDGYSVEDYATDMYNLYEIGKDDMGVLILLSTTDRKIRIETGYNMESYLTDSKCGELRDKYAIPHLKENNFSKGLLLLQSAMVEECNGISDKIIAKNSQSVVSKPAVKPNENTTVPQITESVVDKEQPTSFWPFLLTISALAFIFSTLVLFLLAKNKKNKLLELKLNNADLEKRKALQKQQESSDIMYNKLLENLNSTKDALSKKESNLATAKQNHSNLNTQYNQLYDRYQRATRIYPDVDSKIDQMIKEEIHQANLKKAAVVSEAIADASRNSPRIENISMFNNVIDSYRSLTTEQQSYVTGDISAIKILLDESIILRNKSDARQLSEKISSMISSISRGKERDLGTLKDAESLFSSAAPEVKRYLDGSLYSRIETLLKEAKRDKREREEHEEEQRRIAAIAAAEAAARRRREEEERRRAASSSNNNFSSGSGGSSHSGFGGHSGGGGASGSF